MSEKIMDKYAILFALDGKNFQKIKSGNIEKLWDYFNFHIRQQIALNRFAVFRLVNLNTKQIIGELPRGG